MINCSRLRELLSNYDPNAHEDDVVKSDEQRAKLLARFPKENWPTMTLERYALGQPDQPDNFCRWMEFVTSTIGSIRGGSARKHLIYFQASIGEWWFDHKLYSNVQQAWEAVRSGFVRAIELAEAGAWDQVDQIPSLRGAQISYETALSRVCTSCAWFVPGLTVCGGSGRRSEGVPTWPYGP